MKCPGFGNEIKEENASFCPFCARNLKGTGVPVGEVPAEPLRFARNASRPEELPPPVAPAEVSPGRHAAGGEDKGGRGAVSQFPEREKPEIFLEKIVATGQVLR